MANVYHAVSGANPFSVTVVTRKGDSHHADVEHNSNANVAIECKLILFIICVVFLFRVVYKNRRDRPKFNFDTVSSSIWDYITVQ